MDPIERIAQVFKADCLEASKKLRVVIDIVDKCGSFKEAMHVLYRKGLYTPQIEEGVYDLQHEMQRVELCMEAMQEIIDTARMVLLVNFSDNERFLTFNQEICFSYACKMISSMGPRRCHFSNSASLKNADIQHAEIELAKTSPSMFTGPDLFCYEMM